MQTSYPYPEEKTMTEITFLKIGGGGLSASLRVRNGACQERS